MGCFEPKKRYGGNVPLRKIYKDRAEYDVEKARQNVISALADQPHSPAALARIRARLLAKKDAKRRLDPGEAILYDRRLISIQTQARYEIGLAIELFNTDKITKEVLRGIFRNVLKRQALAVALVSVEGAGNLTNNVLKAVNRQLTLQFAYLDDFLTASVGAKFTSANKANALRYAEDAFSIGTVARRQMVIDQATNDNIDIVERRVLSSTENCSDCEDLAGHWEPVGTLPSPGQGTFCGTKCKCTMETRNVAEDVEDGEF